MKILQVNKFFYVRGGSEKYFFDLCRLLESRGHSVSHFSMLHERNLGSPTSGHFVSSVDFNAPMSAGRKVKEALRILYSREARRKIGRLLDETRPDLVHFHNITRQLSPAIVDAVAERQIPSVQTMHDLFLVCPAHSFFRRGAPCELCGAGAYWHVAPNKCVDGSAGSSVLACLEYYLHAWLGLYRKIGRLIAPSLFLKSKVSRLDWAAPRIVHLPYFVPLGPDYSKSNNEYVLFAGRVSREKGVGTLLEAAAGLRGIAFVIAGEGPEADDFKNLARRGGLHNVRFAGYVSGENLEDLIKGCSCVAVPSVSYENLPLSILEAFARGKPVVGSSVGGIPELVKDGETGYTFEPGDPTGLADGIDRIFSNDKARAAMGRQARAVVGASYSSEYHYRRLMDIYGDLGK